MQIYSKTNYEIIIVRNKSKSIKKKMKKNAKS